MLLAEGTKVNPRIGRLLERVAQYPNIPRKKSKFEVSGESSKLFTKSFVFAEFCEEQYQCT